MFDTGDLAGLTLLHSPHLDHYYVGKVLSKNGDGFLPNPYPYGTKHPVFIPWDKVCSVAFRDPGNEEALLKEVARLYCFLSKQLS